MAFFVERWPFSGGLRMYTSVLLFALSGFASSPAANDPGWLEDYAIARQQGHKNSKPLAVFVGAGKAGWEQVSQEGELGREVRRLLAESYVCVYLDTEKKSGQALAEALEIADGPGIVISNSGGNLQAFRHEGDLSNDTLATYLRRYADPDRVVRFTESNPGRRVSYYAPEYSNPAPFISFGASFGGGGRGGC
jgi:hypothetical protein